MTESLRLLGGPPLSDGAESLDASLARCGARPVLDSAAHRHAFLDTLNASQLRGRGGAGFPVAAKWRSVASRARAGAVVVANGAEGEPASSKDQILMACRPHLVLDGLHLAADFVAASTVIVYLPIEFDGARSALVRAIRERRHAGMRERPVRIISAPHRYISGEESALVAFVNGKQARPQFVPPRPYESGIDGLPTLINNVETLAHVALIARYGERWFTEVGTPDSPGTVLLTVSGVRNPHVYEVALGSTVGDVIELAGGALGEPQAILLGGYFGKWIPAKEALALHLDYSALRSAQLSLGAGVLAVLPRDACGVNETAAVLHFSRRKALVNVARANLVCTQCHKSRKESATVTVNQLMSLGSRSGLAIFSVAAPAIIPMVRHSS